ncbi:MAG: hypothetical protein V1792_17605 [Pseudomonadota bacterium]
MFDTLLLRNTKPESLRFLEIAYLWREVIKANGITSLRPQDLFHARCESAMVAYRTAALLDGRREARYHDILRLLCQYLGIDLGLVEAFTAIELDYEQCNLVGNHCLASQLNYLRQAGKRIVFASDMYLGKTEITMLLRNLLPEFRWDSGYVSSDIGLTKAEGTLYDHMCRNECTPPEFIRHIGDNWRSDVVTPTLRGFQATYWPRRPLWRLMKGIRQWRFSKLIDHQVRP